MEELLTQSPDAAMQEPKRNRGWFRSADQRINREGRPRGSKVASQDSTLAPADVAGRADRIMMLFMPAPDLAFRLTNGRAPWMVNLPLDFEIVDCRIDSARKVVVFTIRSQKFPRIARGTLIPVFRPRFEGLRWRRRQER